MNDDEERTGHPPHDGSPDAQAQAWLSYLYSGDDDEEGRAAFKKWLDDNERNRTAFQRAHDLWRSLTKTDAIEDGLPAHAETSAGVRLQRRRFAIGFIPLAMAGAAAALALVLLTPALNPFRAPVERAVYATAVGEIRTVELPDGSRATLGAETTLEIDFSGRARAVTFERGRAFFEVAHDPQAVFRVAVGATEVSVLGTKFEVAKRRDNISVSVSEGTVAVGAGRTHAVGAATELRLGAGQKVVASLSGALGDVALFDSDSALSWREGHLSYASARLGDVIADFNRHRADKISFADRTLEETVVTVAGDASQIDQMLAGIVASEGLALRQTPSGPVLSRDIR